MTDTGEFTVMSYGMMCAWQVCQEWSISNGALVSSICSWVTLLYLWKKAETWTSRSGSGARRKWRTEKQRIWKIGRENISVNRHRIEREIRQKRNVVVRLLKEGFISPKGIQFVSLYLLKLIQYSWWGMEIIVEGRGTLRVWDFSFQLCLFKWMGNPAMW